MINGDTNINGPRGVAAPDATEGLSRTLAHVLRYAAVSKGLTVYWGGFVVLAELLKLPVLRRRSCTNSDVRDIVNASSRFELLEIDDAWYIRACSGRGKQLSSEVELPPPWPVVRTSRPTTAAEGIPSLQTLCLKLIRDRLKAFLDPGKPDLYMSLASFPNSELMNRLLRMVYHAGRLNNETLRLFLGPAITVLDLRGMCVSDSSLARLARHCPAVTHLSLRGCPSMSDAFALQLVRRCRCLCELCFDSCKHLTDTGLAALASLPELESLTLRSMPSITDRGLYTLMTLRRRRGRLDDGERRRRRRGDGESGEPHEASEASADAPCVEGLDDIAVECRDCVHVSSSLVTALDWHRGEIVARREAVAAVARSGH